MRGLHELILRIKNSLGDDTAIRKEIVGCIKEMLNFDIEASEISMKNNTLRIKTTPAKKNEIKLNEKRILEAVRAKTKLTIRAIVY